MKKETVRTVSLWEADHKNAEGRLFLTEEGKTAFKNAEKIEGLDQVYKLYEPGYDEPLYADVCDRTHEVRPFWVPDGLKYFNYSHLPERLQSVSKPFFGLALHISMQKTGTQRSEAFQRLLEAKDATVRAAL